MTQEPAEVQTSCCLEAEAQSKVLVHYEKKLQSLTSQGGGRRCAALLRCTQQPFHERFQSVYYCMPTTGLYQPGLLNSIFHLGTFGEITK